MPRKKQIKTDEPLSVLQPDLELIDEPPIETTQPLDELTEKPESCSRNYLTASIQSAQSTMSTLLEAQARLAGAEIADRVFDQLEESFVNHLQTRLQPFVDVLVPQIRESHAQLEQRATTRVERRQSAFDRLKQIATLITDECRLSLPSGEPTGNLLGFVSWDVVNDGNGENGHE